MARVKFNITEDHLKLLKHIQLTTDENNNLRWGFDIFHDKYKDIETILKGKILPDDLVNESYEYNDDVLKYYDQIISEIPTVITIILQNNQATVGTYTRLSYENSWSLLK
jgi:hypothetical protein